MIPEILYHGSHYKQEELKPGYLHSGKIEKWDKCESNEFLYTTTDRIAAMFLGFASAVGKVYGSSSFTYNKDSCKISIHKDVSENKLMTIEAYLYEITPEDTDHWILNMNPFNKIVDEYKTSSTITGISNVEKIDFNDFFKDKELTFTIDIPALESLSRKGFILW